MSLKCPNCDGPLKMVKEGTFYCANCDSAFMADYDKDDLEYQKMKVEAEIRKQQLNQAQTGVEVQKSQAKDRFRIKVIIIALVATFVLIVTVPTVIITLQSEKKAVETRIQEEKERQERQKAEEKEEEEKRKQEEAEKEAERKAKLASYRLTAEGLTSDEFFVENANKALEVQLWDNTSLFYDDWVWNEDPEYITSFFLTAKDENESVQNILVSIYKIHWDKEDDDGTDHYVIYDGAILKNISKNEDGTIRCDYDPDELSYHSELVRNQYLSGYTEYDQLIRQEIYGNGDYEYFEFTMPQN
ncbi:MAG: hypothetical protein IKI20_00055 [Lachnospiraceae bacterium]|nr:hypothetical protein [Lachnospiraceae bacterium]